ncbi:MAG: hypothetical protein FWH01_00780 [Oscillospiraceae bacterium]|nr:hypothetical protein [Oscillospiraceae bacterium]
MYKSLVERKNKWLRFLGDVSNERTMYLIEADWGTKNTVARPLPWPGLVDERIEWAYESYNMQMEQMEWLPDDRIPYLSPYTGTQIFAEAFGCKVHYPSNDMPFAIPMFGSISKAASINVPNVHDTPLSSLFEIGRRLRQKAGPDDILQLPDVQSPLDIAALMLNKEEFYVAMLEEPQAVHEMVLKTKMLLTAFFDEWFNEFGTNCIAHFPSYYMEGGITLSEDEVGAFSPNMFNEFVLGAINDLSDRYGGIGIHCCADSEHQWENFNKVKNLRLLNLCNKYDLIERSIIFFGNTIAQWPMADRLPPPGQNPAWLSTCPADARVVLTYKASDRIAALETAKRAEELAWKRNTAAASN